ncbi:disease resistance protein RPV1-like isoform X2 [Nymphaea colorata]|uniref:disease resistance protein RPV1-like isoform X2 n=1 Tax=Nymphaea colorata TaxID=210225 RepID=UPI00214E5105|nr:disease resistance protein RPV1-like isoform X2 [Nymphaea colorata]
MMIFAALFMVLFIVVLFGHVFLQRIKDFLQEDVLRMLLRQFSANQNGNGRIKGNTEEGEEVLEPLTHSPSSQRAGGSEFDVFLSFRGEDTRKGFTGHLHDGLQERGITTFIDCEKLEKGEEINKLLEYIERSKIFVPIFSQHFAESKWCLKEVTKSVECGKKIIPVFFGIEPSDVRNQSGPFKSAFKDHEINKKQDEEEVRKWREALKKVGNLSGFTLKDMNGDEAKLKRAVIERVSAKLNKKPFEVAKHPIGIETRLNDVKKMLEKGGNIDAVHVVGIHGMGGLGKTTIAKAVYNELAQGFNGATCFISNVTENAGQPNGLVNLQKRFIGNVLKEKNTDLDDVAQGKIVIKDRASRKRVLLILDDVDNIKQLDALAGGRDWFGSGSVIIITTRNEEVLLDGMVKQDEIYRPPELNKAQSRELFMLHALNGELPQGEYIKLSNEVVEAAGGLPLTLEVIGSLLSSKKNVQEWKYTLEKLKKIPPREVQQRLKLSYDNLEDLEKKIFLDISCFFISENRENATYMWEGCDWFPNAAIRILVQRSLVKIDEKYEQFQMFEMHDQIRDMGRAIVDEECSRKLQKKSRLWNNQDSLDLLQRKVPGTIDAEGIRILQNDKRLNENYCVNAECFENMPNLRYLQAEHVNFQGTFSCFPTDLKWLQLERCHFDSPPSDFNLEKLVILDLYKTNMAPILINQLSLRFKAFERLKVLSLRDVETKTTPDFMNMSGLVKLQFLNCAALTTIDESIGKLKNLTHLSIPGCMLLKELPDSICQLSSLEVLNIDGCYKFSSLPERLGELGSLKMLDLTNTSIEKVPDSIGQLINLCVLLMGECERLSRLPDSICRLSSLEMLGLNGCTKLCSIPEGLGDMESLKKIDLSETCIEVIPDSIGRLTNLDKLSLCNSERLRELPASICQLKLLKSLNLSGCHSVCLLPERLGDMEKLEELILDNTRIEVIPDSVGQLKSLCLLSLQGCKLLKALPVSMRQLSSIQQLKMSGTFLMSSENDLPHLAAINITELKNSSSELLDLCDQSHKALEILHLKDAIIEELPDCVGRMENLKELRLECEMLKELPNWIEGYLENLTQLKVRSIHLKALPDCIGSLKQLRELNLKCENLKALPNSIGSLKQMWELELNCVNLEALPDSIGELDNVAFFKIKSAKLKALPNSIALLGSVETLVLHCMSLEAIHVSLGGLKKLLEFEVWSNNLEALPDSIGSLKHIQTLKLKCPNLEALPDSIGELESLGYFEVDSYRLKLLPTSIGLLKRIWFLSLNCINLEDLPNSMERLQSLRNLHLHCDNFAAPPNFIGRLENLWTFSFNSKMLKYLDAAIFESLGRLRRLYLIGCENLEGMLAASIGKTDFARLSSLESLDLKDCKGLEYLPQLPSSLRSLNVSGCTNLRKMSDISNLKTLKNLCLGGCKLLEDVPGLENISTNLEVLELPGPCNFTGCCHFSHDFKNKVFKEMTFENLKRLKISGSLVPGSSKGQQQLQFTLPRLPFSWLRRARVKLGLEKVLSPICIAIIADDVTVFEKIAEVDGDEVRLYLGAENIVNTGEGAHCYTMQVTMDVSQLKNVYVLLVRNRRYYRY